MSVSEIPRPATARNWWQRRSLKLKLAACFAAVASAVMILLILIIHGLVERRLHTELDRQLRIDWDLVRHLGGRGNGS